jgi:hypothetical protein
MIKIGMLKEIASKHYIEHIETKTMNSEKFFDKEENQKNEISEF